MIDNMAYDMIENAGASQMVDFLRMMEEYKAMLYMEEIKKSEADGSED